MNKKLLLFSITISFTALLIFGCKKKEAYPLIPNVYVNLYIDINSALYSELQHDGGYMYFTGGNRGILVYRTIDEFKAYERTCPYDPDKDCARIEVDQSGLFAVDSCCMSKFLLLDGSVHSGPSTLPLKQYRTDFDGDFLHIYN
ncbi:MAG: hypothetical protein K9J13_09410 [Saprospiraceae bacterium]|nr:hypothetical protein [Saprospiraceae bacterium]